MFLSRLFLLLFCFANLQVTASTPLFKNLRTISCDNAEQPTNSPISQIYVINLDERPEKLQMVKKTLEEQNLNFCRVSAINGWKQNLISSDVTTGKKYDPMLNSGRIGCSLSHMSVWMHAYKNKYPIVWVLEDDLEFVKPASVLFERIRELEKLDPKWDILYTDPNTRNHDGKFISNNGIICSHPSVRHNSQSYFAYREIISDKIMQIRSRWGTYSMVISRRGLKKLLSYHYKHRIWSSADVTIHHVPKIRQYALIDPVVTHSIKNRKSDTDHDPGDLN